MRFTLRGKAENYTGPGGNGRFAVTTLTVKIRHYGGGEDESLDYSSFNVYDDAVTFETLQWGGAQEYHNFGLPNVKTEDLLCRRLDGSANIEVEIWLTNVDGIGAEPGNLAGLFLKEPKFFVCWNQYSGIDDNAFEDDPVTHRMPCLGAEIIHEDLGEWEDLDQVCDPDDSVHSVEAGYLSTVAIRYVFGHTRSVDPDTGEIVDTAANMRAAVCHVCVEDQIEDRVILASPDGVLSCSSWFEPDPPFNPKMPAKYMTAEEEICFVTLPCDREDDENSRIAVYEAQDDCEDEDCPNVDYAEKCICINDVGRCSCGCETDEDDVVYLGVPHYLDLPKVPAIGLEPHNHGSVEFSCCANTLAGFGFGQIVACFAWAATQYFNEWIPFEIYYFLGAEPGVNDTWAAYLKGEKDDAPGIATISVLGPDEPGITECNWHRVRLEHRDPEGWRLGVDINNGGAFVWGIDYPEPAGFAMWGPRSYY
jgi:hypothetical protein